MDENIVNYIQEHSSNYSPEAIRSSLKKSGYSDQAIDEAFEHIQQSDTQTAENPEDAHDSFFKEKKEENKPKKTRYSMMAFVALVTSFIPVVGFIIGLRASRYINQHRNLKGREHAFAAMVINVILTVFYIIFLAARL